MKPSAQMKEVYRENVPDRLRRLRLASGLRQEEIAKRIGCQRSTYANYETGNREMNISALLAIADALGVCTQELLPPSKHCSKKSETSDRLHGR